MPELTAAARKRIEEKKRTEDQWILDPNIFIKDLPLDPQTKWIKTNNFVQQTISRMLGYDYTNKEWVRLKMTATGKLEVEGIATMEQANLFAYNGSAYGYLRMSPDRALWAYHHDRDALDATVLDGVVIAGGGAASHGGLDVDKYSKLSALISTTGNCTIYIQCSHDDVTYFDPKTVADGDLSWNCSNENVCFDIPITARYIRAVVYNLTAGDVTTTAVLRGQV